MKYQVKDLVTHHSGDETMKNTNAFTRRMVLMLGTFMMAANLAFASAVSAQIEAPQYEAGGCGGSSCGSKKACPSPCICRPAFGAPACYES